MSEQVKSKRIVFPQGEQSNFLWAAKSALTVSWPEFAKQIQVHPRVLNDWKREKVSMSEDKAILITSLSGIQLPDTVERRDPYWYTSKGGAVSGPKIYKKYGRIGGDPEIRKEKWLEWWNSNEHKNNLGTYANQKEITIPPFSEDLAELVGIILGDGCITDRQVKVSLNTETDKEYILFVENLFTKVFGISPSIHPHHTDLVTNIEISRTALVTYLEEIGLHRGHKVRQQVDIPEWIKEQPEFGKACVRGLMDTDGSIFREKHTIKGKEYAYPRLWFVSYSRPLRESVYQILAEAGFCPKVRSERAVTLEKRDDISRYFATIGTHNAKHQSRFNSYMEGCSEW